MSKNRRLLTNFSKGELDPLVDGRPDLAAYFEGCKTLENWVILRQGGADRRIGTRFIAEVKNSNTDTILVPFEASVIDAYAAEFGHNYVRFHKNKLPILDGGGSPIELASPYTIDEIRELHFTQSVDVMTLFNGDVAQHKLVRVSDTVWSLVPIIYSPPPSFEDDTNISLGTATLTPGATSGLNQIFTASQAVFLNADVGRTIIAGAARAVIISFTSTTVVRADILDVFPNTVAIAAGSWFLRQSPQTTLDPNIKEPVGSQVTLVAGTAAFRAADVGKFITIYAGLVKITVFDSTTQVRGEILSDMTGTDDANPAAAPAGAWTLEIASWSADVGFPRTGDYHSGRLGQASTERQKTTFWLSDSDDFDKYAIGTVANKAVEYTIATKGFNQIEWMASNKELFLGTAGTEQKVSSGKESEPIGGNNIPLVEQITTYGSAPIQPIVVSKRIIYVDRSRKQIFTIMFDLQQDGEDSLEITGAASHITGTGIRLGPIAFAKRPDSRLYFIREDGTLITLTYFHHEKVIGFTRIVTDGLFEAVACIPQAAGKLDSVYVIVKRVINGVTKRYVEVFDEDASELAGRAWTSLQTDCAKLYDLGGVSTSILTGLGHLEGKTVDIVADGNYRGTKVVSSAQVTMNEAAVDHVEVGLHYDSTLVTMRPAVDGAMVEGLPRTWAKIWARFYKSMGGKINGEKINYPGGNLNNLSLYTGDRSVYASGVDDVGRITVLQDLPYPMTVLCLFGEIEFGEHG